MKRLAALASIPACVALATPALAHHSFAIFDSAQTIMVEGVVKEVQWTNPHVWVQVLADDPEGQGQEYGFEGGAVAVLKRNGWTSETLHEGDAVVVSSHPFRDGRPGGSLEEVTLADGTKLKGGNGIPGALVVGGSAP